MSTPTPTITEDLDALRVIIENGEIHSFESIGKVQVSNPGEITLALTTIVLADLNAEGDMSLDIILRAQRAVLSNEDIDIDTPKGTVSLRPSLGEAWMVRRTRVTRYTTLRHLCCSVEPLSMPRLTGGAS